MQITAHCKDSIAKVRHTYSQKWNSLSRNFYIHVSESNIYIFLWSVCLFCCRKIGGPIVEILYINRSQKHECGNWDWGCAVSFLGANKSDFLCSADANIFSGIWEVWSNLQPGRESSPGGRQLRLLHRHQDPQDPHSDQEAAHHRGKHSPKYSTVFPINWLARVNGFSVLLSGV